MQLQCVGCSGPVSASEAQCPRCGRAVDADGNGLPDDLDRKVQQSVKKALHEAKAEEAEAKARQDRKRQADTVRLRLQLNQESPRSFFGLAWRRGRNTFLAMFFLFAVGVVIPARLLLSATAGSTPAGLVWCPLQCPECHGPGHIFMWRYRGPWHSNKGRMGTALVCHNPNFDVDRATWLDVSRQNDSLQPYIVHGFVAYLVDSVGLALVFAILRSFIGTSRALKELDIQRRELEAEAARLRA